MHPISLAKQILHLLSIEAVVKTGVALIFHFLSIPPKSASIVRTYAQQISTRGQHFSNKLDPSPTLRPMSWTQD